MSIVWTPARRLPPRSPVSPPRTIRISLATGGVVVLIVEQNLVALRVEGIDLIVGDVCIAKAWRRSAAAAPRRPAACASLARHGPPQAALARMRKTKRCRLSVVRRGRERGQHTFCCGGDLDAESDGRKRLSSVCAVRTRQAHSLATSRKCLHPSHSFTLSSPPPPGSSHLFSRRAKVPSVCPPTQCVCASDHFFGRWGTESARQISGGGRGVCRESLSLLQVVGVE